MIYVHHTGRKVGGLNRLCCLFALLASCMTVSGEVRTWTTTSGDVVEGEYVSVAFDTVYIENVNGQQIKVPIADLSDGDKRYVKLANPPDLKVDFLESAQQVFYKQSPLWADNSPIAIIDHSFGVRVKQTSTADYPYKLVVEGYEFSQQVWDLDKYRLILKFKSKPFVLTRKNREFEYYNPNTVRLYKIVIDQGTGAALPRGQKLAESLVIVRDERGEIVAYRSTAKWLYNNLDRLEKLPVGAWLNDKCIRTHPSSPPPIKLGYMPNTY